MNRHRLGEICGSCRSAVVVLALAALLVCGCIRPPSQSATSKAPSKTDQKIEAAGAGKVEVKSKTETTQSTDQEQDAGTSKAGDIKGDVQQTTESYGFSANQVRVAVAVAVVLVLAIVLIVAGTGFGFFVILLLVKLDVSESARAKVLAFGLAAAVLSWLMAAGFAAYAAVALTTGI